MTPERTSTEASPRILAAFAACGSLRGAAGEDLRAAAAASSVLDVDAGHGFFRVGDEGRSMFVVAAGRVASRLRSRGGQVVDAGFAGPGDLFGYFEVFDGGPRDCDAVALEPSSVVKVPHPWGRRLLAGSTASLLVVVEELVGIVRLQGRSTSARHFETVGARLAGLLLDLAEADGRVLLEGPQTLLAQRLGAARQTVNRVLGELSGEGLVQIGPGGRRIRLLDIEALAARAGR